MSKNYYGDAKTILADVWDQANHRIRTVAGGAGGGVSFYGRIEDILADCWDQANHILRTSGGGGGGGGPTFSLTPPPVLSTWTKVNQGSATMIDTTGGIYMADASGNLHAIVRAAPPTPWTITMYFLFATAMSGNSGVGLVLRDSVSGKLITFGPRYGGQYYMVTDQWASPTGLSGTPFFFTSFWSSLMMLQINDDGTNRHYRMSADSVNWLTLWSEANTVFATINQVGAQVFGTVPGQTMTIIHWTGA